MTTLVLEHLQHADSASPDITIDSSGRIGIGTNTPVAKLHVYNENGGNATDKATMLSEAVLKLQPHTTNSTNLLVAQVNNGNGIGLQVTNGPATANWDLALSPFGGNVGVGTASPTNKLTIDNGSSTGVDIISTTESYINFGTTSNTNLGQIYYSIADNRMSFRTNDYNNVYIDSNGNVGIGTPSPSFGAGGFGLEVKGTGRPTLRVTEETNTHAVQLSATDGAAILESRSSGMDLVFGTSGVEKMRIDDTNGYVHMNSASQIRLTLGNEGTPGTNNANWIRGNQGYLQYNAANNAHTWEVGGTERMRLHPGGELALPYQPSFSAHKTSHLVLSGAGSIEAGTWSDSWMNGAHNTGGHFNTTTGRFTVPIDGRYKFDANIMHGNTSGDYQVWICVNGNTSTAVKSNDMTSTGGSWKQTTLTGIFNLAANDYISIFIRSSTAESYAIYGTATAAFTTCNGYLIG